MTSMGDTKIIVRIGVIFFQTILSKFAYSKLLSNIQSNSFEILWNWNYLIQTAITDLKIKPCWDKLLFNNVNKPEEEK